jgi:hypothetical protein
LISELPGTLLKISLPVKTISRLRRDNRASYTFGGQSRGCSFQDAADFNGIPDSGERELSYSETSRRKHVPAAAAGTLEMRFQF